ncbi:MAG: hypothetical protein D6806_18265 [Deltaproteobacteria bacterium]|nr:MAG: hypothetical protein D6806_18265 [Deltaproteobacteria bacterium]
MNEAERQNLPRYRGQSPFYEVHFVKFNHPASRTACWLRYTLSVPPSGEGAVAELWAIYFDRENPQNDFALKQTHPIAEWSSSANRFRIGIGNAWLEQDGCEGELRDGGKFLRWQLRWVSEPDLLYHFPHRAMYRLPAPKTKVLCPNWNARMSGTVESHLGRFELEAAPGQQEHLWGTEHAWRWAWGHCNAFEEDPDAVWEGLDAQIRLGPLVSPPLSVFFLRAFGRFYRFNSLRQWISNRSSWTTGRWSFEARSGNVRMYGSASVGLENIVGVTYTDPSGDKLYCHNTKVGDLEIGLEEGGRLLGRLTSRGAAAVEFVERSRTEGVRFML